MVQTKRNQEKVVVYETMLLWHNKTKNESVATIRQPDGSAKREIRKRGLHTKI